MYTYTPFGEHFMVHVIDVNVGNIPYMDAMGTDDDYDRPSREPVHITPGEKENHRERCLGRGILLPRKALSSLQTRWWFQTCFIFTPTWGNDPI